MIQLNCFIKFSRGKKFAKITERKFKKENFINVDIRI